MRITVLSQSAKSEWLIALLEGMKRHGLKPRYSPIIDDDVDVVVCWGWRLGRKYRPRGHQVLVLERGYVGDRFDWASLGWNGVNGRATVPAIDDGGERWRQLFGHLLRPWRDGGEYILLVGQVRSDPAVNGANMRRWYAEAATVLAERFAPMPVMFRPHPVEIRRETAEPVEGVPTLHGELCEALERAVLVVTYNSNVGTDAVLAGVPAIACDDGSMAWPVVAHGLGAPIIRPERAEWCARLAWRQWSQEELRDGTAWEHVRAAAPMVVR